MKSLSVHLREYQKELVENFLIFAESYRVEPAGMFKIFDYKNFIEKSLNYKLSCVQIPEGTVKVKINDIVYKITVEQKKCTVEEVDSHFDVELNTAQAAIIFTSFFNMFYENALFSSWMPLCPLSISSIDKV